MRFWLVAPLLALIVRRCSAAQPESSLSSASDAPSLAQLPACAERCIVQIYSNSTCLLTDVDCMCNSAALVSQVDACVLASCTTQEALSTKNSTATACHLPTHNKTSQYVALSIALGTVTIICVIIRLIFNRFWSTVGDFGIDDKVLCVALALRISCMAINVQGLAANGIGKDVWTLPPDDLTAFVKYLFVMVVLYLAEVSLMKLVLSLFFLRLFPGLVIQRLIWATIVANILYGVVVCTAAIFQCTPVSHYWTQYVEHSAGRCVNTNAFGWANASISVAMDIWMMSIPLSQIRRLNLYWSKKLVASVMFLLGSFVTIVSILRLRFLIAWAYTANPTFDEFNVIYWSTIEVNVGLICACLPAFRLIFARIFPRFFNSANRLIGPAICHSQGQLSKLSSQLAIPRRVSHGMRRHAKEGTVVLELPPYNHIKSCSSDLEESMGKVEGITFEMELADDQMMRDEDTWTAYIRSMNDP